MKLALAHLPALLILLAAWAILTWIIPAHAGTTCGLASTYGRESGHTTANGEAFDGRTMTAASRGLPFGTKLRVTMLDPRKEMARWYGKSVTVRINDRGPYIAGRFLDLATAAAAVIGLTHSGVSHVCAERLP